jgi:chromosome segregation ATPase
MRIRTKLIISALVGGASLAAAIPAQAQSYPNSRDRYEQRDDRWDDRDDDRYDDRRDRYDDRYDNRYNGRGQANAIRVQIEQLERRIQRTDGRDRISEREAAMLRRAVYGLRQQYREFSRGGLSQREAQILQSRIQQVRQRLTYERRDNDGRRW